MLVKEQTDTLFMEALEYAEQIGERSTEPIQPLTGTTKPLCGSEGCIGPLFVD